MNSFEKYIQTYLNSFDNNEIISAMKYAMDGGKRFRPNIIFSIVKGAGINEEVAYPAALALEMIQTYSLIHDDLPAMDNDDMRRGKPSLHKAFREDVAILTGDALLTHAFAVIADAMDYSPEIKVNMISDLSRYAGMSGMIYGQLLDVTQENRDFTVEELFEIDDNKTGGLFKIACLMAMNIAGFDNYNYYKELGSRIGNLFQLQDDLFDAIKTEEETGKSNSDIKNDKATALSIYSIDELSNIIDKEFDRFDEYLSSADFDTVYLKELLNKMAKR